MTIVSVGCAVMHIDNSGMRGQQVSLLRHAYVLTFATAVMADAVMAETAPEQDVSKLDVAAAAPIKHEHHMEGTAQQPPPATAPDFVPIKQEQLTDTAMEQGPHMADATHASTHMADRALQMGDARVRMAAADAEMDPLQHGHPSQLQDSFDPLNDSARDPAFDSCTSPPIDIMTIASYGPTPQRIMKQANNGALDPNSSLLNPTFTAAPIQQSDQLHENRHRPRQHSAIPHTLSAAASVKVEPMIVHGMAVLSSEGGPQLLEASDRMRQAATAEPAALHHAVSSNGVEHGQQHMKAEPMDLDTALQSSMAGSQHAQEHDLGE